MVLLVILNPSVKSVSEVRGRPSASPDAVADTVVLGKEYTRLRMRLQLATHKDAPLDKSNCVTHAVSPIVVNCFLQPRQPIKSKH